MNKKVISYLLIITIILNLFCLTIASQAINVKDYIKGKFPSIFSFYFSSLENLDLFEKEFIDLLQKLPGEEQEYYAKEVYKNGFSLELLEGIKEGKTIKEPTNSSVLPSLLTPKEESTENLPYLIKRIEPSIVIVFTYRGRFDIALKKEEKENAILRLGSGFFISQNGDVITNYHVLQGAGSAEVKTLDGKTYPITHIVAVDEQSDIIRLSIDIPSKYVRPLSLSSTVPEVGERIIVYGSPLGLEKTVSDGIISAIREVPAYGKVIQITAPVSPGSSGSPVINMKGEVIGVATFQMVEGQNLNFAIPSERIARLNLAEEKKKSITEELFKQESKTKKVIPATDEAKIKSVINEFFSAINDQRWSKAKSCCVYGSEIYYIVCQMEDAYNIISSHSNIIIIDAYADILNISINGNYSKAYCYGNFSIAIYDGDYESDSNYYCYNLQKVSNSWKLLEIGNAN